AAAQPQAELTGAGDEPGDVGGELVAARRAIGEAGLEPDRMEPDLQLAGEYLGSFGLNLRLRGPGCEAGCYDRQDRQVSHWSSHRTNSAPIKKSKYPKKSVYDLLLQMIDPAP